MTEMKFKNMMDNIETHLIAKHGIAYLSLSKEQRIELIAFTFHEFMQEQRERQA